MFPEPGEVLHFSEEPDIPRFVPRPVSTRTDVGPYVWAVDRRRAPDYWFPRDCPRVLAWPEPDTAEADRADVLGPGGGDRVHAIEYSWLTAMHRVRL